jgi:hypothetical protein
MRKTPKPSVQHEAGKADIVTEGGATRQVPEGEGEKAIGQPTPPDQHSRGGHINGEPVSREELDRSTQ